MSDTKLTTKHKPSLDNTTSTVLSREDFEPLSQLGLEGTLFLARKGIRGVAVRNTFGKSIAHELSFGIQMGLVLNTPSDQKPREEKTEPYQDPRYKTLLETKGSFIRNYVGTNEEGIKEDSKRL
jgi:hypothetical protein